MKTTNEMINSLYRRREIYLSRRRKYITAAGAAAAAAVTGAAVFGAAVMLRSDKDTSVHTAETSPAVSSAAESIAENSAAAVIPKEESIPESEAEKSGGDDTYEKDAAGGIGDRAFVRIPAIPPSNELILTGEVITDEEAAAYFAENRVSLISSLAASGVPTGDFTISGSGSCCIFYNGVWDEQGRGLELIRSFRHYYAYSGGELVAVLTLAKENGRLSCCPAFGGAWMKPLGEFMQKYKGQELIFIRADTVEMILAPDGEIFFPGGHEFPEYLEGVEDPYKRFYHSEAVYIP